jgi:hypothetical protein
MYNQRSSFKNIELNSGDGLSPKNFDKLGGT